MNWTLSHKKVLFGVTFLVLAVAVVTAHASDKSASSIGIEWLLPHRLEIFSGATSTFATVLARESGGDMMLQDALFPQDVNETEVHKFKNFVSTRPAGMISEYASYLGNVYGAGYAQLDLPFLFDDYPTALSFLDGPSGQKLLSEISEYSPYQALAFSMSGGMRVLVSKDRAIHTVSDARGQRVYFGIDSVLDRATLESFGMLPTSDRKEEFTPSKNTLEQYDAIETTYSRMKPIFEEDPSFFKYVTETNHSVSLTVMLVSKSFYNSLSEKNQKALRDAALQSAKIEKQDTIASEDSVRDMLKNSGTVIITPTTAERDTFKKASQGLYNRFGDDYTRIVELMRDK